MTRILVIDDEKPIRTLVRQMLEKAGYEVTEASDGKKGMTILREESSDLVITDILMPDQEGLQTIKELRRDYPEVKIIAISGGGAVGPETYLQTARRFGADRTLTKPFSRDDLLRAVGELI